MAPTVGSAAIAHALAAPWDDSDRTSSRTKDMKVIRISLCILSLALCSAVGLRAARHSPYAEGEVVEFTGVVTDVQGIPVPDVHVVLDASDMAFSFTRLKKVARDGARVAAITDSRGEFSINWRWRKTHDRFDLSGGVPIKDSEGERFEVLQKVDLSRRVLQGSPVVVSLTIENADFVRQLSALHASIDTEDERAVYEQMGNPDKVERIKYPESEEVSWWYFRKGRTYRFVDGQLRGVNRFEPITSIEGR